MLVFVTGRLAIGIKPVEEHTETFLRYEIIVRHLEKLKIWILSGFAGNFITIFRQIRPESNAFRQARESFLKGSTYTFESRQGDFKATAKLIGEPSQGRLGPPMVRATTKSNGSRVSDLSAKYHVRQTFENYRRSKQ